MFTQLGHPADTGVDSKHSSKRYGKIETTIKKDQEVYLFGILHEIDSGQLGIQRTQYCHMGKN